jgi:hypothetical protein
MVRQYRVELSEWIGGKQKPPVYGRNPQHIAECEELSVKIKISRHGVLDVMARAMMEAGAGEDDRMIVFRGDMQVFEPIRIGWLAKKRLHEIDNPRYSGAQTFKLDDYKALDATVFGK